LTIETVSNLDLFCFTRSSPSFSTKISYCPRWWKTPTRAKMYWLN